MGFIKGEAALWGLSVLLMILSFCIFDRQGFLTLAASLIGVTSLIFNAKGHPVGQLLMVFFSGLYGWISFTFAYYGEMITYLGMTAPMAVFAFVSWVRNPYEGNRAQVKVSRLKKWEAALLPALTGAVTWGFYDILAAFHTANLVMSTVSVATSFLAAYLTFRRSRFFALAYGANDMVLVVLWALAAAEDRSYLSVTVCFGLFFIGDLYGFASWSRMQKRQRIG
ncbi:MAG: nicotinamide mononucleotide transporter [Oscillospiraceae bacterium]|nr:nicotinamide mononucleotide transporter [Oscillospiraceae bacterium]